MLAGDSYATSGLGTAAVSLGLAGQSSTSASSAASYLSAALTEQDLPPERRMSRSSFSSDTEGPSPRGMEDEMRRLRSRNAALEREVVRLREVAAGLATATETEEDLIANKLLKSLEQVKSEKARLGHASDAEREFLPNQLQLQLRQVRQEKVDVESKLEAEQDNMFHKLQQQIQSVMIDKDRLEEQLRRQDAADDHQLVQQLRAQLHQVLMDKGELENRLEAEQEFLVNKLQKQLDILSHDKSALQARLDKISEGKHEGLVHQIASPSVTTTGVQEDESVPALIAQVKALRSQVAQLRSDNFVLRQQVEQQKERLRESQSEASRIASDMEAVSERQFNVYSRRNSADGAAMVFDSRPSSAGSMRRTQSFVTTGLGVPLGAGLGSIGLDSSQSMSVESLGSSSYLSLHE